MENDVTKKFITRLKPEIHEKFKTICFIQKTSMQQVSNELIENFVKAYDNREGMKIKAPMVLDKHIKGG